MPLQPAELLPRARQVARDALRSQALEPIATDRQLVEEDGICFQLRVVAALRRKDKAALARPADFNPFLPPEPRLVVGDISQSHLCVLNKFNVIDEHLLLITRAFVEQQALLDKDDFEALAFGLQAMDGLAFYNAGEAAGASQRHKHLQLVPPLGPDVLRAPIEALIAGIEPGETQLALPFRHAFSRLDSFDAQRLLERYGALLQAIGCSEPPAPYNLLVTREWMLAVPRSQEAAGGISVNALGFAGSLLFRTEAQREQVRQRGCLSLLAEVASLGGRLFGEDHAVGAAGGDEEAVDTP